MNKANQVIVIGGGVIGLACAHYLNAAGAQVRVIEKNEIGSGASHGNCGVLFFSDIMPLCAPGAVTKELVRALRGQSPLHIKPEIDFHRWHWLLNFALHCRSRRFYKAAGHKSALLAYSRTLFEPLLSLEGMNCDLEKNGVLVVFKDHKSVADYGPTVDLLSAAGIRVDPVKKEELQDLEPALAHDRLAGACLHKTDWYLRPEHFMSSWQNHLSGKGVRMEEHNEVRAFYTRNGRVKGVETVKGRYEADAVVLAAGVFSPGILNRLDLSLPVEPGKGYSITMARPALCPSHTCYLHEKNVVVTPWKSGYRIGGTMEFSGFSQTLNTKRLEKLLKGAACYLQSPWGRPVLEQWTGLRPMTFDDMPVIDRVPGWDNVMIATGHGMLGLTLAPATGRLIADLVFGRTPEIDTRPYGMARFSV